MSPTRLLAIDPGNVHSAYVIIDEDYKPIQFGKVLNAELQAIIKDVVEEHKHIDVFIERIASYGMAVGEDVFQTCFWIGRFQQQLVDLTSVEPILVKRIPVKTHLCHTAKAKDSNVTQALVDRFTPGAANYGKGTKKDPGFFYGFAKDVWAAFAVAVYAQDTIRSGGSFDDYSPRH